MWSGLVVRTCRVADLDAWWLGHDRYSDTELQWARGLFRVWRDVHRPPESADCHAKRLDTLSGF